MISNIDIADLIQKKGLPISAVISKDQIDQLTEIPDRSAVIVNLEDDTDSKGRPLPGSHWTCLWFEGTQPIYFDSFGLPPPQSVDTFLREQFKKPYAYTGKQIQSIRNSLCGYYVMGFIHWMHQNGQHTPVRRFEAFLDQFEEDPVRNSGVLQQILDDL